jgi:hypothetical protein
MIFRHLKILFTTEKRVNIRNCFIDCKEAWLESLQRNLFTAGATNNLSFSHIIISTDLYVLNLRAAVYIRVGLFK